MTNLANKNSNETGKIIPFIKEWKSERLEIRKNKKTLVETFNKNILKQIAHINFSNMTTIWVNEDHISSIEGLSRMWMPVLRILSLRTG